MWLEAFRRIKSRSMNPTQSMEVISYWGFHGNQKKLRRLLPPVYVRSWKSETKAKRILQNLLKSDQSWTFLHLKQFELGRLITYFRKDDIADDWSSSFDESDWTSFHTKITACNRWWHSFRSSFERRCLLICISTHFSHKFMKISSFFKRFCCLCEFTRWLKFNTNSLTLSHDLSIKPAINDWTTYNNRVESRNSRSWRPVSPSQILSPTTKQIIVSRLTQKHRISSPLDSSFSVCMSLTYARLQQFKPICRACEPVY